VVTFKGDREKGMLDVELKIVVPAEGGAGADCAQHSRERVVLVQ
jgi:hypothetical protein